MGKQKVNAMIEAGKATPAPPLGPALGPTGVNTKEVIDEINLKTKELAGMKVPITVIINDDKSFDIEVGTPPVSALIKKELNLEKGCGEAGAKRVGDLTEDQVKKVAKMKFGSDSPEHCSQVKGTARSMGITVGEGAITKQELEKYDELDKKKEEEAVAKEAKKESAKKAAKETATETAGKSDEKPAEEKTEDSENSKE